MGEHLVRVEEERGVVRALMERGANALDLPLMEALKQVVIAARGKAVPLLLSSTNPRVFCPGWNLKQLAYAGREEVARFLSQFTDLVLTLFSYPGPTLAAIGGHAIAGGCSLALACDHRVMATGRPRIGMAEVNLGVPVPAQCVQMLRARLAPDVVDELVFARDGLNAERAAAMGIVQRVAPPERLDAVVEQELSALAARPARAYAETKRFSYQHVWERMAQVQEDASSSFVDCWFAPDTQARVQGMAARLSR